MKEINEDRLNEIADLACELNSKKGDKIRRLADKILGEAPIDNLKGRENV